MRPGRWAFSDDTHKKVGDPPGFFYGEVFQFYGEVFHGSSEAD